MHHLSDIPLQPLSGILNIECASGNSLPYIGCVEANIFVPGISEEGLMAVFLVVPDLSYHDRVPGLPGTNILNPLLLSCQTKNGIHFLKRISAITPWWLCFRTLNILDKIVKRCKGKLGILKCSSTYTHNISGNTTAMISCTLSDAVDCNSLAMFQRTQNTTLPDGVGITPTVFSFHERGRNDLYVQISNPTNRMITISPRATICEVQQVSEINEDVPNKTLLSDTDLFLEQFNLDQTNLSSNERDQVNALLISYRDIFSSDELIIGHTTAAKHRIDLYDPIPVKERHRRVPPAMYQEVK